VEGDVEVVAMQTATLAIDFARVMPQAR